MLMLMVMLMVMLSSVADADGDADGDVHGDADWGNWSTPYFLSHWLGDSLINRVPVSSNRLCSTIARPHGLPSALGQLANEVHRRQRQAARK